jgi:hypothetical protein
MTVERSGRTYRTLVVISVGYIMRSLGGCSFVMAYG